MECRIRGFLVFGIAVSQVDGVRGVVRINPNIVAAEHVAAPAAAEQLDGTVHGLLRPGRGSLLVQIDHLDPALLKAG